MAQQNQNPIQQATPGTNATIAPFFVGGGAAADSYGNLLAQERTRMEGWGNQNAPNCEGMFSKYVDVANREANRQASQIGETLGSRGALYSSANLNAQSNMRQKTAQDIGMQSQAFLKDIEDQRQRAEQVRQAGMAPVMTGQAGYATAEMGAREAAMARAYQDFLRRSDVPPLFSSGAQWGASRPGGSTYAY